MKGTLAQGPGSLGLSVSPQIFELDVFPGETLPQKIKVGNLSEAALPIAVRVTDFTAAEDSGEMLFDESSQDPSFASRFWFNIENPNFILEPEEKREVRFSISVPENAEPGGHYAVILFEPQLPSYYFKPGQPRAIPVVGVLFLISVRTLSLEPISFEKPIEIVEFRIPEEQRLTALENFFSVIQRSYQRLSASIGQVYAAGIPEINITKKAPSSFVLRIKNNDIYHIKPSGKVLIHNFWGKKVGETEVPKQTILPGKTRQFPVKFSPEIPEKLKWLPASITDFLVQNFFVGKYQARLDLEAKTPLSPEIFRPVIPTILTFFSLPWQFWLPFILIFGTLIFLTFKYRRRITLAFKTLLKPA